MYYDDNQLPYAVKVARQDLRDRVPTLIRRTAKEMAGVFYDEQRTEEFRKTFPKQRDYVRLCWPDFVKVAREVLISMLSPTSGISEHMRMEIYSKVIGDESEIK